LDGEAEEADDFEDEAAASQTVVAAALMPSVTGDIHASASASSLADISIDDEMEKKLGCTRSPILRMTFQKEKGVINITHTDNVISAIRGFNRKRKATPIIIAQFQNLAVLQRNST
jgi:hypothetical protein